VLNVNDISEVPDDIGATWYVNLEQWLSPDEDESYVPANALWKYGDGSFSSAVTVGEFDTRAAAEAHAEKTRMVLRTWAASS